MEPGSFMLSSDMQSSIKNGNYFININEKLIVDIYLLRHVSPAKSNSNMYPTIHKVRQKFFRNVMASSA